MKKIALAVAFAAIATTGFAGGTAEPKMEPTVIAQETAQPSNENWVFSAFLILLILAAIQK
ncbi:MAG: hypothetical protein HN582_06210 [Marinovum sp.]|nr:hypothetical protein [Marinovum sp.]